MAVGQAVLTSMLDVGALAAVEGLLEVAVTDRCAAHGRRLRLVLRLHAVMTSAGGGLGSTAQLALLEQTCEQAAQLLLSQAELLAGLPGALEAVECGLLTLEQCTVLARKLIPLPDLVRLLVWHRLKARLLSAGEQGVVLAPARLGELLARWAIQTDPAGALLRRRVAQEHGSVDYRRGEDGLADLFLNGVSGPNAQAILSRIRDRSRPWGAGDDRTAGKRRVDAAVDLLLGRDQLALDDNQNPFDSPERQGCAGGVACGGGVAGGVAGGGGVARGHGVAGGGACGCRLGEPVPCGVQVSLLIPLGAALGTTDEVAMLEGHGPVEPDLLQALLHNAPTIRPVWVDTDGVPVAVGDTTQSPPRHDAVAVRQALQRLAGLPPGQWHPRHPDDHPDAAGDVPLTAAAAAAAATAATAAVAEAGTALDGAQPARDRSEGGDPTDAAAGGVPCDRGPAAAGPAAADQSEPDPGTSGLGTSGLGTSGLGTSGLGTSGPGTSGPAGTDAHLGREIPDDVVSPFGRPLPARPRLLAHPHPVGTPGRYRVPTRLARLLRVRAPRCEWPACGHGAAGCDRDHDLAHPAGPTCGCNLGPLCRRHHRLKQLLMSKTRGLRSAVTWTSPTGRRWLSPSQHQPPLPISRPAAALHDVRGPGDPYDEQDGSTDLAWLDGTADRLRADDPHESTGDPDTGDPDSENGDPYDRIAADGWGLALDDPYRWAA